MKKILVILVSILASISLIGCADMSKQDVGTVSGAVAGGLLGSTIGGGSGKLVAVGIGTLAGALIGGSIGKSMDDVDKMKMQHALESAPVGQPVYWQNRNNGANYTVVPVRNVTVQGNQYCREYRTTAVINGKQQQMYGTACRQPDGSWKAVS